MNRVRLMILVAGWRRHPWLRMGTCLTFALGFGIACLACQIWLTGQDWLHERLGQRPAGDTITVSLPGFGHAGFSPTDVAELAGQDFVLKLWPITTNQFRSRTAIQLGTSRFSTELFFDAVPDDFLSPLPEGWNWPIQPGLTPDAYRNAPVPILVPRDFLNMYNYGFALARQLPQLGPEVLALVPLDIAIESSGRTVHLSGRIIGVTDQLPTILVPQAFMDWANRQFGRAGTKAPERMVAAVKNAGDPAIAAWATKHGWLVGANGSGLREAFSLVMLLVLVFGILGILILALAILVLFLDRHNQLYRDRDDVQVLITLGHQAQHIAWLSVIPDLVCLTLCALATGLVVNLTGQGIAAALGDYGDSFGREFGWMVLKSWPVLAILIACIQKLQFIHLTCKTQRI